MPDICPVCSTELKSEPPILTSGDKKTFSCPRCGDFSLSGRLLATLSSTLNENKNAEAKISHALRMMQHVNQNVELSTYTMRAILEKSLPRPQEQADLLIRWLAEHSENPGDEISLEPLEHYLSIIGSKSKEGFHMVLLHLIKIGLVGGDLTKMYGSGHVNYAGLNRITLTFAGWNYFETLLKGSTTYRKAFMAMKFGDFELNAVLENVFKPNVKKAGFDLFKLDDEPRAGLIDDRLRVEIQSSDFLIADLTHENNGAYWEAGYAEGLGKPVIYTCEKEKFELQKTHFDTNHHLTVTWDKNSPEQAGELLKATIRATLPHLAKQED